MSLVPDIRITFETNGQRKELSYRKLPFSAWSELKGALGFTPVSLLEAVETYDLEAFGAIIWLERKQQERQLRWVEVRRVLEKEDVDFEFVNGYFNGIAVRDEEEVPPIASDEPDPTPASS